MGYVIELDVYQGPFDLLLDLVAKNEVDLWDIPIAAITEQYLAYLYSLQEKDLAITGEFLVMAATLIRIKSRMLLPQEPPEDETLEESEDPRTELVQQLVRYKFFKEAADFLQQRYAEAARQFTRGQRIESYDLAPVYTCPVGELTLEELRSIYQELISESEKEPPVHTISSTISLEERLALVRLQLMGQPRATFSSWSGGFSCRNCSDIFGCFGVGVREIRLIQTKSFGEIDIRPLELEVEVQA